MKSINFRRIEHTPEPYNATHGLYQCEDGSLLVLGYIPSGPLADAYFEKFRTLKPAMADITMPMLSALKTMGAEVEAGQRMRRVGAKETNDSNPIPVQNGDNAPVHSEGDAVQKGAGGTAAPGDAAGIPG